MPNGKKHANMNAISEEAAEYPRPLLVLRTGCVLICARVTGFLSAGCPKSCFIWIWPPIRKKKGCFLLKERIFVTGVPWIFLTLMWETGIIRTVTESRRWIVLWKECNFRGNDSVRSAHLLRRLWRGWTVTFWNEYQNIVIWMNGWEWLNNNWNMALLVEEHCHILVMNTKLALLRQEKPVLS